MPPAGGENHPWLRTLRGKVDTAKKLVEKVPKQEKKSQAEDGLCKEKRECPPGEMRHQQEQAPEAGL